MDKKSIERVYQDGERLLSARLLSAEKRGRACFVGEVLCFLLFVAFLVAYTTVAPVWTSVALAFAALAAYFYVRHLDVANDYGKQRLTDLRKVYLNELDALHGDYAAFDHGDEYVDPKHPFTYDLDIFGRDSLYNRVSRCATVGGSRRLADYLSFRKVNYQAQTIETLSRETDWRMRFMAHGARGPIDTSPIGRIVREASAHPLPASAATPLALAAALTILAGFYATVALAVLGEASATIPILYGCLQFFAVYGLSLRPVRAITRLTGELRATLPRLTSLIAHAQTLPNVPNAMKAYMERLSEAEKSFRQLDEVARRLDRRGNLLGLLAVDTFALSDFFLIRRFVGWQRGCENHVEEWLEAVVETDALVSMATFRFNNPDTVYANVVDGSPIVYHAEAIRHPFLGENAVANDFDISDGHYYIVTGANMAGKSTFLRALGVNYVLALNGMPVFARSLTVSKFRLFSSMRANDDLSRGISYFNAELIRLRQLVDYVQAPSGPRSPLGGHTLVVLDEILRGTNSLDKLNGSRLFLEYMAHLPVSGVIATHDLELSKMRGGRFHNYCFEIGLGETIAYSYKITPGVAVNQNATYLLRQMLSPSPSDNRA